MCGWRGGAEEAEGDCGAGPVSTLGLQIRDIVGHLSLAWSGHSNVSCFDLKLNTGVLGTQGLFVARRAPPRAGQAPSPTRPAPRGRFLSVLPCAQQ